MKLLSAWRRSVSAGPTVIFRRIILPIQRVTPCPIRDDALGIKGRMPITIILDPSFEEARVIGSRLCSSKETLPTLVSKGWRPRA